jgi:hypothetical protein
LMAESRVVDLESKSAERRRCVAKVMDHERQVKGLLS